VLFDLPSGAMAVCALAGVALLFVSVFLPLFQTGRERLGLK